MCGPYKLMSINGITLNILDALPTAFVDYDAKELSDILPGPTLIHIHGAKRQLYLFQFYYMEMKLWDLSQCKKF